MSVFNKLKRRKVFRVAAAVLIGMGCLGLFRLAAPPTPPASFSPVVSTTDDASGAVLPSTNMSANPGSEYFSDGLTETLLNRAGLDALNPQLYPRLGDSLLDSERYEDARKVLLRSAELAPDNPDLWASLGELEKKSGNATGYVENYRRAIELDPENSELLSRVADYLFRYGLIEEGDSYLRRAEAIAPLHPMTRASRLQRRFAAGDREQAAVEAKAIIAEDVPDRHGAYTVAVTVFADLSVAAGDAESAYLFLENNASEVNHPERSDVGLKYLSAQSVLFPLWFAALPDDQALEKLSQWAENLRTLGFDESNAPRAFVDLSLLSGDTDTAVAIASAEIFSLPAADFPDWEAWLARRHMAGFATDPRLASALARYAAESATHREELSAWFARVPSD